MNLSHQQANLSVDNIATYINASGMPVASLDRTSQLAAAASVAPGYQIAAKMDGSGLNQLWEALERTPNKEDYVEAQRRVPFLVATESPPIRFLHCENFDPWAAANRLVSYWKERKALFGERAFLPMNQTGNGALSAEDLIVLNTKFVVILPPDQDNRTILYYDKLRMVDETLFSIESRLRTVFYWYQVASENPVSQSEGIISMNPVFHGNINMRNMAASISMLNSAFPLRVFSVHLLCPPQGRKFMNQIIPCLIQLIRYTIMKATTIHTADTKEELIDKLQKHGISRDSIPAEFGGLWTYDGIYEQWKPQRVRIEKERHDQFLEQSLSLERKPPPRQLVARASSPGVHSLEETEGMYERALAELEDALELISPASKAALLEARQCMPSTVNKEADPIRFLRFENFNTWAAAQRLAVYWSTRKSLFGERAFLPMNQTGEGTLNSDDIALLNTGFVAFLPDDTKGHGVVCIDTSRRKNYSGETRSRVAFYATSVACENDMTQKEGLVILNVFNAPILDQTVPQIVQFIFGAFPLKVHLNHIGHCPNDEKKSSLESYFVNTLVPLVLKMVGKFVGKQTVVHVGDSAEELRQKLEAYGLKKESLPECMGGTWSYSQFPQWQDVRIRYEWDLPTGTGNKNSGVTYEYTVEQYCNLSEQDKVERRRKMNILNSRRKRERRKIEGSVLHEQVDELKELNGNLVAHNRHLEDLLEQANAEVAKIERVGPPAEKRKASDTAAHSVRDLPAEAIILSAAGLKTLKESSTEMESREKQMCKKARKV